MIEGLVLHRFLTIKFLLLNALPGKALPGKKVSDKRIQLGSAGHGDINRFERVRPFMEAQLAWNCPFGALISSHFTLFRCTCISISRRKEAPAIESSLGLLVSRSE